MFLMQHTLIRTIGRKKEGKGKGKRGKERKEMEGKKRKKDERKEKKTLHNLFLKL